MSDLGAIFHVKKSGTQYDAHAYTTTKDCPEPNLKINFKGTTAFVSLVNKGSGDVPCFVKKSDGSVYQVKKEFKVPTDWLKMNKYQDTTFVVPAGVKVVRCEEYDEDWGYSYSYVGVTPGSTHILYWTDNSDKRGIRCKTHNVQWTHSLNSTGKINWSPEINTHYPDVRDYT